MTGMEKEFKSQQEYALYLSKSTLEKILIGDYETHIVLRACYAIASFLGDSENIEWIHNELRGYPKQSRDKGEKSSAVVEVPSYRMFKGIPRTRLSISNREPISYYVPDSIHRIEHSIKNKENLRIWHDENFDSHSDLTPNWCYQILSEVQDKCLKFLVNKIAQLEFAGRINTLITKIQEEVNNRLVQINLEIATELQSISNNIISDNKSDLSKVAHSCRRILKLLADEVYPASSESYIDAKGIKRNVSDDAYMNRLLAFLEKNKGLKIIKCEVDVLSSYLDSLRDLLGKGEHSEITNYETEQIVIHIYLVISEILKIRGSIKDLDNPELSIKEV